MNFIGNAFHKHRNLFSRAASHAVASLTSLALLFCAPQNAVATPITLLHVSGAGTTGQVINAGQAAAVSFTLGQAYSGVAISAEVLCVACNGSVYLMKDRIGPTAALTNIVTGDFFNVSSSVNPIFNGLSLGAGNYFLVVAITTAGGAGWTGSLVPSITTEPGILFDLNYFASTIDFSAPFRSPFLAIASSSALHFSIVADATAPGGGNTVDEPSLLLLLGIGAGGLMFVRRRQRPVTTTRFSTDKAQA